MISPLEHLLEAPAHATIEGDPASEPERTPDSFLELLDGLTTGDEQELPSALLIETPVPAASSPRGIGEVGHETEIPASSLHIAARPPLAREPASNPHAEQPPITIPTQEPRPEPLRPQLAEVLPPMPAAVADDPWARARAVGIERAVPEYSHAIASVARSRGDAGDRENTRNAEVIGEARAPRQSADRSSIPIRPPSAPADAALVPEALRPQPPDTHQNSRSAATEADAGPRMPVHASSLAPPAEAPAERGPEFARDAAPRALPGSSLPVSAAIVPGTVGVAPVAAPLMGPPDSVVPAQVTWLAARGGGAARVVLQPAELGEVEIAVRVRGNSVEISIQTEKPAVQNLILAQRGHLGDALAVRDLRIESLDVHAAESRSASSDLADSDRGSERGSSFSNTSSEREADRGNRFFSPGQASAPTAVSEPPVPALPVDRPIRLDVHV